jgi:hypothetical protein
LLDNSKWWYIVGGVTLARIIVAAIGGSMFANSEATWQTFGEN